MLYICGHWTWPGQEGQTRAVAVANNCETVELFLNGASCGVRERQNPACWNVPYQPGTLVAIGLKAGQQGRKTLSTAGDPATLKIAAHPTTIQADGSDVADLTVWVVDRAGATVSCAGQVHFRTQGPGTIRGIGGEPVTLLAGGMGRILVQAGTTPGPIVASAQFGQLPEATVTVDAR